MAHYAFLNKDNIVTEVIIGKDEGSDGIDWESHYSAIRGQVCKRTSYNTFGNVHYGSDGKADGGTAFRKNYAGVGYTYDESKNAFIAPQPYVSWKLNETTCLWESPVAYPNDGNKYDWNESAYQADNTKGWEQVS